MAHILAVEDEADLRNMLREELTAEGYEVVAAANGKEALQKLASFTPDIIISDISMPEMGGFELLESVRKAYLHLAEVPFLFLTAFNSREDEIRARDRGVDDYITKPIDLDLLLSILSSRLRQVARMRERKEQQLIKVYKALNTQAEPNSQATITAEAVSIAVEPTTGRASEEKTTSAPLKEPDGGPEMAPAEKPEEGLKKPSPNTLSTPTEDPKKQPVYGTVFQFPNLNNLANELGSEHHGICARIRERATAILKRMLFESDVVSETAQGDIFVCYSNADKDQAQEKSKQLSQALQDDRLDGQHDEVAKTYSISRETMAHALIVSESLFEVAISQEDLSDTAQFEKAVLNVVEETRENKRAPTLLVASIKNDHGCLKPLTLIACNGNTLPIRFFNYDESSKLKMRAGFAFFGKRNLVKAGYLIDMLTLALLEGATKQVAEKDIVVVDVHFETLISKEYAPLYMPRFRQYAGNSQHTTMINVRSIPPDITSACVEEILRPLGKAASRRAVQINPGSIKEYTKSRLPVSCIVCSCPEPMQSQTAFALFPKVKPALSKTGTLLVLRGLSTSDDIPQFNNVGFDGYAVNEPQSD